MTMLEDTPADAAGGRRPVVDRTWLIRALLESVLIIFSVLLALGVDEWRAEHETARRVDQARTALVEEIRNNRRRLTQPHIIPYHQDLRAKLDLLLSKETPGQADFARAFTGFTGTHPFIGQDAVWQSVNSGDVAQHLPRDELLLLSAIYTTQSNMNELHHGVRQVLSQPDARFREPMYLLSQADVMRNYLGDALPQEQELLGLYDKALAELTPTARGDVK